MNLTQTSMLTTVIVLLNSVNIKSLLDDRLRVDGFNVTLIINLKYILL